MVKGSRSQGETLVSKERKCTMKMKSIHWDEVHGVCTKDGIPMLPCPACLSRSDKDIEFVPEQTDVDVLDFANASGQPMSVSELIPAGFEDPNFS